MSNTWIADYPARKWIADKETSTLLNTLSKRPTDAVRLYIDFGNMSELINGDTILTPTITVAAGVTVASVQTETNGYQISGIFSGGTQAVNYNVTATIVTAGGATISRQGVLQVIADAP